MREQGDGAHRRIEIVLAPQPAKSCRHKLPILPLRWRDDHHNLTEMIPGTNLIQFPGHPLRAPQADHDAARLVDQ